jgi:hypothetical protein
VSAAYGLNTLTWWESSFVGIEEGDTRFLQGYERGPTIVSSVGHLHMYKDCEIYDVSGRRLDHTNMQPGVYFIEDAGEIAEKIVVIK